MNTNVNADPIELEWEFDNPNTHLTNEMQEVATAFIQQKLGEINNPSEFGFESVDFNEESIFISRNNDTHVFECFVGW